MLEATNQSENKNKHILSHREKMNNTKIGNLKSDKQHKKMNKMTEISLFLSIMWNIDGLNS